MIGRIPGVPSLLKELGIRRVGNFILPCVFQGYARWLFQEHKDFNKDLNTNELESIVTQPYGKIDMRIFSAVDAWAAEFFFINLIEQLDSNGVRKLSGSNLTNFLTYRCRIQDLPRIKDNLFKLLPKLEEGQYVFKFSKHGPLKNMKKVNRNNPFPSKYSIYPYTRGWISVFLDKRSDIDEEMIRRSSTIIDHHTFHTYGEHDCYNRRGIKEVLETAKKLGSIQLTNLHRIRDKEDTIGGIFPISKLRKGVEKVGFDSIYYAEVERKLKILYRFNIKKLSGPSEIEDVKTGNYRWLILKSD